MKNFFSAWSFKFVGKLEGLLTRKTVIVLPGSANSRSAALDNSVTHTERSRTKLRRRIS